jgi:hypothetical protein
MRCTCRRRTFLSLLAGLTLTSAGALRAQTPESVPAEYRDLYAMMDAKIAAFEAKLGPAGNAAPADVAWGAELLTANCNRGRQLLDPRTLAATRLELTRLQSLGVKAVTVCIGFPLLYRPFFDFNGDAEDYDRFVAFYRDLSADVHGRGMKLIVETSVLFGGVYSQGSGLRIQEYYPTLDAAQLAAGRAEVAKTIVREVKPDFLNLGSEPDTQARLTGRLDFATPDGNARLLDGIVKQVRAAGVGRTRLGAGVGSWQGRAGAYVAAICGAAIDFVDLHVYPVNGEMLDRLIPLTEQAARCGKRVAISEAWLQKERDSELGAIDAAFDQEFYARDGFSFWAPLDQRFLAALVKFSRNNQLLYFSPFWSKYFWAYLDHAQAGALGKAELVQASSRAAGQAMLRGETSVTGEAYRRLIKGSEASMR